MTGTTGLKVMGVFGAVAMIVLGVLMIAKPMVVEMLFDWIIGIVLVVGGAGEIIAAAAAKNKTGQVSKGRIIAGAAIVILGIFVLVNKGTSIFIMGMIIAVLAFALAFQQFSAASARKKAGLPWGGSVLFGIIHLLFGIFMAYNCFATIAAVIVINGIYLLVAGVMMFVSSIVFKGAAD